VLRGEPVSATAALRALVDDYAQEGEAELVLEGDVERLTGEAGEAVLRVVQESLTNARKHAPAARVEVQVRAGRGRDDGLVVTVHDDGGGRLGDGSALAASGGGYGLRGMRERAELLGGSLRAGADDGGWTVELRLPSEPAGTAR
jgi:signal transduction histidine kinase